MNLLKKYVVFFVSLFMVSTAVAQNKTIYLLCEGEEVTQRGIQSEKNTKLSKTLSLELSLNKNKVVFKKNSVPLKGLTGKLRSKEGLIETVTESEYSIFISYTFSPPIKGGGEGSFIINRFTGKAKSLEYFTFANEVEADVFTVEGNYSCNESTIRKF